MVPAMALVLTHSVKLLRTNKPNMVTLGNTRRPRCCLPLGKTQTLKRLPQRLGHQTLFNPPPLARGRHCEYRDKPNRVSSLETWPGWQGDVRFALSHPKGSTAARGAGCAQSGNRTKPLGLPRHGAIAFQLYSWAWAAPLEPFFIRLLLQMQLRAIS